MHPPLQLACGLALAFAGLGVTGLTQEKSAKEREAFFEKRVAPVLKQSCIKCHRPGKTRNGLDLSTRASMLEGGIKGPAIVPGNAKQSLLLKMIDGPKPKMPKEGAPLAKQDVEAIVQWLDDGAAWPDHVKLFEKAKGDVDKEWWSLRPLERPALPAVKDKDWSDQPIDRFILALLEANSLKPSEPADRVTFIRRVTYDLHGLPPTPEEIDAFVADKADDAFEKLVDRLLASPRYGERWGRHWLDIIHYADTHGYDKDKRRLWAWLFRDWIIRALNEDMPYRRFVRYQVAGDVLFPDDPDGIIATGFIAAGPWDFVGHVELREGTVDKEKTRLLDRDDMLANTMSTFCSLTVHCARCHDHKFDPIPQKDYYRLQAVFAGVERGDRPVMLKDLAEQKASMEKRRKDLLAHQAKVQAAADNALAPKLAPLDAEIKDLRDKLAELPKPKPLGASGTNGYHSQIAPKPDVTKWVQVDLGKSVPLDLIRLIPARPVDFPDTPGFGFPIRFQVALSDDPKFEKAEVVLDESKVEYPNPGDHAVSLELKGKSARYIRVTATKLWKRTGDYVFALAELQALSGGKNLALDAPVTALDSIEFGRWSKRHLVDAADSRHKLPDLSDPDVLKRVSLETKLRDREKARQMKADELLGAEARDQIKGIERQLDGLAKQIETLASSAKVYAVLPSPPRPIHILDRGDVERKGAMANPGGLSLLPDLNRHFKPWQASGGRKPPDEKNAPKDEGPRRAALADWITDDANAFTWRSIVNRVWQYHFGKGLVDTPNDFGQNGSQPSHPELLDWLAVEFRDKLGKDGGSLKKLHRAILLSKTYRQASAHNPAYAKIDADNRLLWRMNRQRLDAESIRDSVLAVSGKLDLRMHGPGFELFRFKDDHSPVYDHLDLARVNHPETWRRTVYRFVVRSVPNPFLESLDCADPNINVPVRNTTLTALQALALLNNPFMIQQAEFFAARLKKHSDDPARQVEYAYRLAFGRPASVEERDALAGYARKHSLANACRLLFNANEFVFVD